MLIYVGPMLANFLGPMLICSSVLPHVGPTLVQHVGVLVVHVIIAFAQRTKPQRSTMANNVRPTLVQHKGIFRSLYFFYNPL